MSETYTLKLVSSWSISPGKEGNIWQQSNLNVERRATWPSRARQHCVLASPCSPAPMGQVLRWGPGPDPSRQLPALHEPPAPASRPSPGGPGFAEGRVLDRSIIEMWGGEFKFHLFPSPGEVTNELVVVLKAFLSFFKEVAGRK